MGKRGAKPWEPSWEEFNKLCAIQATLEEIAAWYDVDIATIERTIKRVHQAMCPKCEHVFDIVQ